MPPNGVRRPLKNEDVAAHHSWPIPTPPDPTTSSGLNPPRRAPCRDEVAGPRDAMAAPTALPGLHADPEALDGSEAVLEGSKRHLEESESAPRGDGSLDGSRARTRARTPHRVSQVDIVARATLDVNKKTE